MNEQDLYTVVTNHKAAAIERQDQLADRFTKAWGFYRGELPEVMAPGDVAARKVMWESFESLHPSLVAIFTDDQKAPVAFSQDGFGENKVAQAITRAVHAQALAIADWDLKIYLALKETLITGNQAALIGYDTKLYKTEVIKFDNEPAQKAILAERMITRINYEVKDTLVFTTIDGEEFISGEIWGEREVKYPVISLIPLKDFYLHPKANNPQEAIYSGYSEEITNAEGLRRGYKKKAVKKALSVDTNSGRSLDTSMLVVGDMNDTASPGVDTDPIDDLNNIITVFHHFWRGCYNDQEEKLYHVITTNSEYISHEVVDYVPLVWGAMAAVPGSAYGESLYDYCWSVQEGATRARRAMQRTADFAAYPDMEVDTTRMSDKAVKQLNDQTKPGKIYPVRQIGAINRLPSPDMPHAAQLLSNELTEDAKRVIQGSASQARAMEKTNQSGTAIALVQAKDEVNENSIAKIFAETFIKPAYRIFLLLQKEIGNHFEVDGDRVPFALIRDDIGLKVDVKSAGDRAQAAANVLNAYTAAAQAGTLPANFTEQNVYAIYADYLRAVTHGEDVDRYITPPSEMPKPSEAQQKLQAVIAACQLRHAIAVTKLAEVKVQTETAGTQKTLNDAAVSLAQVEQILAGIDIDKLKLVLEANKDDRAALKDVKELAEPVETPTPVTA